MMQARPSFAFDGTVTPAQRQFYDTYGFIVYQGVVSPQQLVIIAEEAQALEQKTLRGEIPPSDIDDITPMGQTSDGKPFLHRLPYFTRYSPQTSTFIESNFFLALGKGLLGEHAWLLTDTMHGTIFQQKLVAPKSSYSHIHWHIDFRANHTLAPVVSAGIYLDRSTVANGCLLVIPATHHHPPGKFLPPAIPIEVEAGDIICHADRIYHASTRPTEVGAIRRTLYLYFCGGVYPGPDLPFSSSEIKRSVRTLFTTRQLTERGEA